jgi:hypothetical protein
MNVVFDMIGYWLGVTLVSSFLLLFWVVVTSLVLDLLLYRVSSGELKWFTSDKISNMLGFYKLSEGAAVSTAMVTFIIFTCSLGINFVILLKGINYIDKINEAALSMTPFLSWLGSAILGFIVLDFIGRKLYNLSRIVKKLQEKENK